MSGNLIVYPSATPSAGRCFHALTSTRNRSSAHTHFVENTCVLAPSDEAYNCGAGPAPFYNRSYHIQVERNRFYFPKAPAPPGWGGLCSCWPDPAVAGPCPYTDFASWQADGHDRQSTVSLTLRDADLLARARALLSFDEHAALRGRGQP